MILINPDTIQINESKLLQIDRASNSILRKVIFCEKTSSQKLLNKFVKTTNTQVELLSIKNAQMEAQNEQEVKQYLKQLNEAILFLVNEIKNDIPFTKPLQMFQLFRIISPESHEQHPNRFRNTLVQIGSYICPSSNEIPQLIEQLFSNIQRISHPVIRAIYFHHELIRIHPFIDGNGRITRIAKNWMLMYNLYPPIYIKNEEEKKTYILALSDSFKAVESNPNLWHKQTSIFFEQELERIIGSIKFITDNLNDVKN